MVEDISRPLDEQRGAIVEVNAGPGLLMHLKPASGRAASGGPGDRRQPVSGRRKRSHPHCRHHRHAWKPLVARLVARLLHLSGKHVGLACSDGLYLDQRLVEKGNRATWARCAQGIAEPGGRGSGFRERQRHDSGRGPGLRPLPGGCGHQYRSEPHLATSFTLRRPSRCSTCCAPRSISCCPMVWRCSMPMIRWWWKWRPCVMAK